MKIELLEILAFEEKRIKLDIDIAETSTISELNCSMKFIKLQENQS